MARLFLRLYLMAAVVLIATIVVDYFEELYFERLMPMKNTSSGTAVALLQHDLSRYPESEWAAEVERIRRDVPHLEPLQRLDSVVRDEGLLVGDGSRLRGGKIIYWEGRHHEFIFAQRVGQSPYVIEYVLGDTLPRTLILWANMAVLLLIVVAIAIWFWVRPLWNDLRRLDVATERLSAGEFDERVRLGKSAVLHPLAESLNWMAERIGALLASHRSLTNAVSHELRTPLARLRFAHTLAMDESDPVAKNKQLLRMRRDMDELDRLAGELLTLAKLERAIDGSLTGEPFPANEWLEDRIEEARMTALATGRDVTLQGEASIESLTGSPQYLARAFDNIVNNAMRHAESRVEVAVRKEGGYAVITVDDDGPGIPESERQRVFEPFVRLDESRDRASGGVGLGLAIVRQIARTHGGDCRVDGSPLKGARFVLSWPLHRRA
jgi:signal transduction histidine kinase